MSGKAAVTGADKRELLYPYGGNDTSRVAWYFFLSVDLLKNCCILIELRQKH